MSDKHDLGNGWLYNFFTEKGVEGPTGLIIFGPAAPQCIYRSAFSAEELVGMCGGSVPFTNSIITAQKGRPMWKVESWEPLTLSPSIKCGCDGQHGHITNGVYVPC